MQQTLVALNDKPPAFVGSREWMGSYELSILLDHYYHVRKAAARQGRRARFRVDSAVLTPGRLARGGGGALPRLGGLGAMPDPASRVGQRLSQQGERARTAL